MFTEIDVKPTSMIDVSDGLSSDLIHICQQSEVGCTIYEDKIPLDFTTINVAEEMKLDPVVCALNGGEDYELLLTIKQQDYENVKSDVNFTIIGHISDKSEGNNFLAKDGSSHPLTAQGWDTTKTG